MERLDAKWYRDRVVERQSYVDWEKKQISFANEMLDFWTKYLADCETALTDLETSLQKAIDWENEYKETHKDETIHD